MIEWREEGVLLAVRKHGETSVISEVFTEKRGRHLGVIRGGTGRKLSPILQPGTQLDLTWKARLEDHLGAFTVEPLRSRMGATLGQPLALLGLGAVTALLVSSLPERMPYPKLYRRSAALLDLLGNPTLWPLAYLQWEMALLTELGFGLDLTQCAATGQSENLHYVSPKTGRAVSQDGAGDWAPKLLPLPPVLRGRGNANVAEILRGLDVTGHFIEQKLLQEQGVIALPAARERLLDVLEKIAKSESEAS